MPQSDGKNRLKRMEFVVAGKSFTFSVNPEEYTQDEPSRSTVTQTKGGAWVDDFGGGLPIISIRGSTGFKYGLGVQKFKELRDLIRKYYNSSDAETEFVFHNWTDDESWVVHTDPQGFRLLRNKNNPLLYMYDIRLICLRPASHPKPTASSGGVGKTLGSAIPNAPGWYSSWVDAIKNYMEQQLNILPKLPPLPSIKVVKPLKVAANGTVLDAPSYTAQSATDFNFTPQLSPLAVDALAQYKTTPSLVIIPATDGTLPAQLQQLEEARVPASLTNAFRMVLLEALAIWEQIQTDQTQLPKKISEADIDRVIENTQWLAEQLFQQPSVDYSVVNNLRWLARALQYVKNSDLYKPTYASKVGDLNNALR